MIESLTESHEIEMSSLPKIDSKMLNTSSRHVLQINAVELATFLTHHTGEKHSNAMIPSKSNLTVVEDNERSF